jgi:hypothetical protein
VNGSRGKTSFFASSTTELVTRLNVARDIGASASYGDGNRYREFPAQVFSAIMMSTIIPDRLFLLGLARRFSGQIFRPIENLRLLDRQSAELLILKRNLPFRKIRAFRDYRQQTKKF